MAGGKRKAHDAGLGDPDSSYASKRRFSTLRPRIKRLSQDVIKTKWGRPPPSIQHRIRDLFKAAETPIITSVKDDRREVEAQTTLNSLLQRLNTRVPRMPFPPSTKEIHFDYERLLARNRALEAQLTPAVHSIELFRSEVAKERQRLGADQARLDELKRNARTEESMHKRQAKKNLHPLLHQAATLNDGEVRFNASELTAEEVKPDHGLETEDDQAVAPVLAQLQNHLESMHSNTSFLEGIGDQLIRSRAAVETVLINHLDPVHYARTSTS
ncbi:MAG: hypothetical protein M1837_005520 [Sclerophora amabilis]|nr:MAG: hypothetical protein M1837_005520 [Sclerophora amabilis]